MKTIGIICLLCNLLLIVDSRRECVHKDFGNGATVCVCNSTYCDNLDPITKQSKGTVLLYESSKSGDRFKKSQLKFNGTKQNNSTKSQTITIDVNKKFQKIIGFGGAFTDSSGINIGSLPHAMQNTLIEDYFSDTGIEYTVGRVPIAGTDFSTHAYSYDDHENDVNLTKFALTKDDFQHKIPFLKLAQTKSKHKILYFGSPWSSPGWMKTNGKINNGGYLKGQPGGEYYKIFANYFVRFLDEYKKNGVDMWGITIENEPGAGPNVNYSFNSLGFTAETQRDFLKMDLGPILTKAGYDKNKLKIMIYDDQRPDMVKWADVILKDAESAKYASGIAFHWYNNNDKNLNNLNNVHEGHPNHFILATESSQPFGTHSVGNFNTAENYAHDIITDLQHFTAGYVDWNIVLNMHGGPSWVSNRIEAPILVDAAKHEYYKQPVFYYLGHFSKFIIPDSVKIESKESSKIDRFETIAFLRPDNAIVVVAFNRNNEKVSLTINDPNNGKITHEVKPQSIQSYIYWN